MTTQNERTTTNSNSSPIFFQNFFNRLSFSKRNIEIQNKQEIETDFDNFLTFEDHNFHKNFILNLELVKEGFLIE